MVSSSARATGDKSAIAYLKEKPRLAGGAWTAYFENMRATLRLSLLASIALVGPAFADPAHSLIGKSDFDLVSCAGTPASVIDFSKGRQIMTFVAARSTGGIIFNNNIATGGRFDHSCEAIVQLQNGVVTKVEYKQHGGFITAGMLCRQVLSGC